MAGGVGTGRGRVGRDKWRRGRSFYQVKTK